MAFPRILLLFVVALFFSACAQQEKRPTTNPSAFAPVKPVKTMRVRTTAYTHTEAGGARNAIGQRLSYGAVRSAAADWSHFPLGTKFKILDTGEIRIIDDYGSALVGTSTIDLYTPSRRAMRAWGVRNVEIAILEWGSPSRSLEVLSPRQHNRYVRRMVIGLKGQTPAVPRKFKRQPTS